MSAFYDVFRVDPDTKRPVVVRTNPCTWETAVDDYFRYVQDGHTVSIFEVTETGKKIREITPRKRTNEFSVGTVVASKHTTAAVVCEIGTDFVTCMWGDNNRRKYEPSQVLMKTR